MQTNVRNRVSLAALAQHAAALLLAVVSLLAHGRAQAESILDQYMQERQPRRLALIVANDEYKSLGVLPGVKADLNEMKAAFKAMGFDVVEAHENVKSWEDFQYDVLKPFRTQVQRDDLVVVYFSGHGFSYAGYQYFAPSGMPKQLVEGQIATTAIPVETLASVFQAEGAGGVVLIVDACRTIADFVIKSKDGSIVPKGGNDGQSKATNINYVLALSVKAGLPSQASTDPSKMSTYSQALFDRINEEKEFRKLHDDVEFDVSEVTNEVQIPALYDFTWTDILLLRSDRWTALERERWQSILSKPSRSIVEKFARRYTLSPYIRAARLWLHDHPAEEKATTVEVSPVSIEAAWKKTGLKVRGLATGVQFPQEASGSIQATDQLDRLGIQLGEGAAAPTASQLDKFSDFLASQRELVVQASQPIRIAPDLSSPQVAMTDDVLVRPEGAVINETPKNLKIERNVSDFVFERRCVDLIGETICTELPRMIQEKRLVVVPDPNFVPRSWVKVDAATLDGWFSIDNQTSSFSIDVGEPFEEMTIRRRDDAPTGLADLASLSAALSRLGERKLSWASIATPQAEEESYEADLVSFMTANLTHALRQAGLVDERVTIVSQDPSVIARTLRVRLFTTGKD